MRVTMIVNPQAGRGHSSRVAGQVAGTLRAAGWEVDIAVTTAPEHAETLAREAASDTDLVVACGGDGTLSEVLNGLFGTDVPAALLPVGTGNDFARTLGLPRDPGEAAFALLRGAERRVDLLQVVETGRVAINVMGVGFDATVAATMNRHTRRGGLGAYLLAVLIELGRYRMTDLSLQIDGEEWEGQALLVAVANAQSYGAGMRIAPRASVTDGLLDVVLVEPMNRLGFLCTLPKVFTGRHVKHPAVRYWQAREVTLRTSMPVPVLIDGDLRGETPVTIRVLPQAARLWLPDQTSPPRSAGVSRAV
ncbi:MAG: diacylglycerol kinase family protein [Armatimonadia bacterium]